MKSKTVKFAWIGAVFSLLIYPTTIAQSNDGNKKNRRPSYAQLLEKLDMNEDGKLSLKEVKGPLKDHYDEIDINEDGFITKEEFDRAPNPKRKNG